MENVELTNSPDSFDHNRHKTYIDPPWKTGTKAKKSLRLNKYGRPYGTWQMRMHSTRDSLSLNPGYHKAAPSGAYATAQGEWGKHDKKS